MRAVNLIPSESRQRLIAPGRSGGVAYVLVGLLAAAVLLVTIDVITANTISERRARVAVLQRQAQSERALAARLAPYTQFAQLAAERTSTVREIAAARFDWQGALMQLSRVVPAGTSLSSLVASVAPGTSVSGSSSSSSSGADLRSDISSPAFELAGCTGSQDEVARLMSRLRLISGVTRVSLEDSQQGGGSSSSGGCAASSASFNIVVWFQPLPTAGPNGLVPAGSSSSSAPSATGASPAGSTASGSGAPAGSTAGAAQPAGSTASGAPGSASGSAPTQTGTAATTPPPGRSGGSK
jgi:Tfp pilus assembly protein PilN